VNFESYSITFGAVTGDGIRIAGSPGGSATFVSVAELRVFGSPAGSVPSAPALQWPPNRSVNQPYSVTLRWAALQSASRYHVQVARDPSFTSLVISDSSLIDSCRELTGLGIHTRYYWRVKAGNAQGSGQFSSGWSFTTAQKKRNVSQSGSPISLVTRPTGSGNPDINVIRDGVRPAAGGSNPMEQFDTYTGLSGREFDWIGYEFESPHQFSGLLFQEGIESSQGGWFSSLTVQARVGGAWVDVQNLTAVPPYAPNNGVSFETYEMFFDPLTADGVRIAGRPGGSFTYVSAAELQALVPAGPLEDLPVPREYILGQNYPNPFNPATVIPVGVPQATSVLLRVYNMLGEQVATLIDGPIGAGWSAVEFSGSGLSSGVYYYALTVNGATEVRRMLLLK
jgi:hypothetical protein